MSSPAAREYYRKKRTEMVEKFCRKADFVLVPLNSGYQLRIENVLDVYPVNGRWCWLPTGERGDWNSINDLRDIMLKHLPYGKPKEVDYSTAVNLKMDGFKVIGKHPQELNVLSTPAPKRLWLRLLWARIWRRK